MSPWDEHQGVWLVRDEFDGTIPVDAWDEESGSTEICHVSSEDREAQVANAQLIAASPVLFAALEDLLALITTERDRDDVVIGYCICPEGRETILSACNAIAAAKGKV